MTAAAQDPGESERAIALEIFQRGRTAYMRGELDVAEHLFRESLQHFEHPNTLFNLGMTCERRGDFRCAVEALTRYTEMEGAADVSLTRQLIDRLRMRASRISIRSEPSGARVFINGEPNARGITPLDVELAPGDYTIRAVLDHYDPSERPLVVEFGEHQVIDIALEAQPGRVTVRSEGRVSVDGAILPDGTGTVSPGAHVLRVEDRGRTSALNFYVSPGEEIEIDLTRGDADSESQVQDDATRFGLGFEFGGLASLDTADGNVPESLEGSLALRVHLPCVRHLSGRGTCFVLAPTARVAYAGQFDGSRGMLFTASAQLQIAYHFNLRWALEVGSEIGVTVLTGLPLGARLPWFPQESMSNGNALSAPSLGVSLAVAYHLNRHAALTLTPIALVQVLPQGGWQPIGTGLTRFAFRAGFEWTP